VDDLFPRLIFGQKRLGAFFAFTVNTPDLGTYSFCEGRLDRMKVAGMDVLTQTRRFLVVDSISILNDCLNNQKEVACEAFFGMYGL
jgi:hypothetical protein